MVGGISKRQQFRNERALQDLIRSVPGNDRCADCQAMNPGWASWNMGIFLCMRCAALHRKMGTHISKVKSLSMDSWTSEQVDNMKSHGNTLMNKIFNPRNVKPPVPADIDEADACMERFIRQKYQHRSLEDGKPKPPSRQDSGYTKSPEGSPPPLPPKPGRPFGFGLRSASSATNLHRLSTSRARASSLRTDSPPPPVPSPFGGMGASVGSGSNASFEAMMGTLRDMGFQNERRNATVLRELDGNLDKSIETLVRLGEGSNPASRARTPAQATATASSSMNPFDQLDHKPPAQPTGGPSYNPFDMPAPQAQAQPQVQQPSAQQQPLEQSFQNLQVSQPLFPHSTGGYPNQQSTFPQPYYQQSATPPVAGPFTQSGYVSSPQPVDGNHNPFFQSGAQQPQASYAAPTGQQTPSVSQTNPFFSQAPQSASMQPPAAGFPPPRHVNTMPTFSSTSPFGQSSPFQQPQQPNPQLQVQPPQQGLASQNPFQSMTAPTTPQSAGYQVPPQYGLQAPNQRLAPQPTGRVDKNSILSLYNFSPPPSAISEQPQFQNPGMGAGVGGTNPFPGQQAQAPAPAPAQTQAQTPFGSAAPTQTPFGSAPPQQSPFGSAPPAQSPFGSAPPQQSPAQPQFPPQQPTADPSSRNPFFTAAPGTAPQAQQAQQQPQPAQPTMGLNMPMQMSMPMNPAQPAANPYTRSHMSQQSVDISGLQNGRHSPDAFASLSARYG